MRIPVLSAEELRVLGCLVEKELTTPQQYPLTLNALTLGCNQSSNRDPVVSYDERTVENAVTSAKSKSLARFVHPSHGRSAIRYAHTLAEALGLDARRLALLSVLMLRGPQTPGELRTRTERMERFEDLSDLERELERLLVRDTPLVQRLPRRPGQKEDRFVHLLGDVAEGQLDETAEIGTAEREPAVAHRADEEPVSVLERQVLELREEVEALRSELAELKAQLGS